MSSKLASCINKDTNGNATITGTFTAGKFVGDGSSLTGVTIPALTGSRVVVSDSSGKLAASTTTATEMSYLQGVTSAIQTQLDSKAGTHSHPYLGTATGTWHGSSDNQLRFYYGWKGKTYFGAADGYEWRNSADGALMSLTNNGRVGIGTTDPKSRLHVAGPGIDLTWSASSIPNGYKEYNYTNAGRGDTYKNLSTNVCYFAGDILMWGTLWAASDERIKTNITCIDAHDALSQVRQLKPCTFVHKDRGARGHGTVAGFIAQEVEQVMPFVVTQDRTEYVPNICELVKVKSADQIELSVEGMAKVKEGDKIKLYVRSATQGPSERYAQIAKKLTATTVQVAGLQTGFAADTEVYVYGTEVTDFRTVDYESVFTMTVAAVQALDDRVTSLLVENKLLRDRLDVVESILQHMTQQQAVADLVKGVK